MIGYYNYTVILTYIGTLCGFMGIIFTRTGNIKMALICLLAAGFCDMFDGKIASTMKRTRQEKRFGIQIDSLSDLICFGVLPSLIVLECSGNKVINMGICALYVILALIRLAWFNVDEEERQTGEEKERETYLGLPVTSSALIIPFVMGTGKLLNLSVKRLSPWCLLTVALAFVLPFRLKKPGLTGKLVLTVLGVSGLVFVLMGAYI